MIFFIFFLWRTTLRCQHLSSSCLPWVSQVPRWTSRREVGEFFLGVKLFLGGSSLKMTNLLSMRIKIIWLYNTCMCICNTYFTSVCNRYIYIIHLCYHLESRGYNFCLLVYDSPSKLIFRKMWYIYLPSPWVLVLQQASHEMPIAQDVFQHLVAVSIFSVYGSLKWAWGLKVESLSPFY